MVVSASLPEISGLDLIRRLKLLPDRSDTTLIFTTGRVDRDLRRKAFELGVYAYLEKPINPAEFFAYATRIVNAHLERIELHARLEESDRDDLSTISTMHAGDARGYHHCADAP